MSRYNAQPALTPVETPDFGTVYLRPLTAPEYFALVSMASEDDSNYVAASRMIRLSLCEADGSQTDVTDDEIRNWPLRTFDPVADAVLELNGLGKRLADSATATGSRTPLPNGSDAPTLNGSSAN